MFSDPVSFNGATRVEVIAVLANCGRDTDRARRALVTWIRHKQDKGRTTEHILAKLRDIESKFIKDTTLHSAFRDARAETCLPRAPDLPLPPSVQRKSNEQTPESLPTPKSAGRASISSSLNEPSATSTTSPLVSPLHLSWDSSPMSKALPGNSNTSAWASYPQSVSHVSSRSPRIQIPRNRSLRHGPSSPVTSSPEEFDPHLNRYSHTSQPVGSSSQSTGLMTPVSVSPPESRISRDKNLDSRGRSSYGLASPPPSVRITIPTPHSRSQRAVHSPPNSSSDESDFHPRRYRPISQPVEPMSSSAGHMSPGRRRVTSPRTCPPDVPLPPIPSDDQGADLESGKLKKSLPTEHPNTPVRSPLHSGTPVRPLPIQPIPSPVPGSDDSESHDTFGEDTLRQNWQGSNGDLPSDVVVRQDSPVYEFRDDHVSSTSPPPPYAVQLGAYGPPDMPSIGISLERAVNECGGLSEVRVVVSKCIGFRRGYEPPYWQSRLQACGLDAEAARYLVDEMSKQVDWAMSFRRTT